MEKFKVVIVEDVKLELKGTEEIFRHEIQNAEVIGTAMTEEEFWKLMETCTPDMVLLDLGLGGSTTIGVVIMSMKGRKALSCRATRKETGWTLFLSVILLACSRSLNIHRSPSHPRRHASIPQ